MTQNKLNRRSVLYTGALTLLRAVCYCLLGARAYGRQYIPQEGPVILMCNHIHALDPLMVAVCARKRQVHFMAKKELFRPGAVDRLLRNLHAFPVDRGKFDLTAMRASTSVLKAGEPLGIFPEGTRGDGVQIGPLLSGAALLAIKADCPVIPMYISGRWRPFGKLRIIAGPAVPIDDLRGEGAGKDETDLFLTRMRAAIEALIPIKQIDLTKPL